MGSHFNFSIKVDPIAIDDGIYTISGDRFYSNWLYFLQSCDRAKLKKQQAYTRSFQPQTPTM
ncbi:MAG: hypothetical protein D6680_12610 [Cyanobacteria bacterium J007]|nr:MAG: hypothetical protein D6680_12610 [Cyanobacteria bacterium J007]